MSPPLADEIRSLARETLKLIGGPGDTPLPKVDLIDAFLGGGYGVVGALEREAIRLLARREGILLDPVYTGRAMGGLLHLVREKAFGRAENVLFWHTGGTPALFAYARDLAQPS
jgi:D-cysteine desulfhydrase